MTWHADDEAARRYAARTLDPTSVASIEAHLVECADCRTTIGTAVDAAVGTATLDAVWESVTERLDRPSLGPLERLLCRAGCAESTARIIAATSRARWSYLLAVALSLILAIQAALWSTDAALGAFLVVAPIGPLVATAAAFGRQRGGVDELLTTVPTSPLRILLLRVIAAVTPALAITALSIPWLIERGWLAVAWLLPSLALACGAVALSSWMRIEGAVVALGVAWIAVVVVWSRPGNVLDLFGAPAQVCSLLAVVVAVAAVVARRSAFEYGEV